MEISSREREPEPAGQLQEPTAEVHSPVTPPSEVSSNILITASSVLSAQAAALTFVSETHARDEWTQRQFYTALQLMHNAVLAGKKLVLTGIGKSIKIADKLCATMSSLGIPASVLHPSDALHGDLGLVKPADVVIFISSSGDTAELKLLSHHLPSSCVFIALTCTAKSFLADSSAAILYAPVPQDLSETAVYGLAAPTVSTTACLAVGDAVCITLAEMLVADHNKRRENFGKWHPGGKIGELYKSQAAYDSPR